MPWCLANLEQYLSCCVQVQQLEALQAAIWPAKRAEVLQPCMEFSVETITDHYSSSDCGSGQSWLLFFRVNAGSGNVMVRPLSNIRKPLLGLGSKAARGGGSNMFKTECKPHPAATKNGLAGGLPFRAQRLSQASSLHTT